MTLQVVIIRPLLSFIAAVMWAEGVYIPGYVSSIVMCLNRAFIIRIRPKPLF